MKWVTVSESGNKDSAAAPGIPNKNSNVADPYQARVEQSKQSFVTALADIDELKQIVKDNVKRKNVHEIIEAWIEKLSAEKVKLEEAMKKEEHERPK
jgi:hypothetical protein